MVVVEAALADEVRRLLPDAKVKILTGAAPWEDMAGALGAARVLVVASGRAKRCDVVRCRETTSAMLRCRPRTLVLEVGGTRDDEALARELALGYRAVADVARGRPRSARPACSRSTRRACWHLGRTRSRPGRWISPLKVRSCSRRPRE